MYDGHLDGMNGDVVYGWALNVAAPAEEVTVTFYHARAAIGQAVAKEFREDLRRAKIGLGHGSYGFSFRVPAKLRSQRKYTLRVYAGGSSELAGSPLDVNETPELPFRKPGSHVRDFLAQQYLCGKGIEIGALNLPCQVAEGASVTYVDSKPTEELLKYYAQEMRGHKVVNVDVVTDAHTLAGIDDRSQDFVIANQVLEHMENPLQALENFLRVTKSGGIVFLSLPDKRYTFDVSRPPTRFEHILEDYRSGPAQSREAHYQEWIELVDKAPAAEMESRLDVMMNVLRYPIHFHVWTQVEMFEMFNRALAVLPHPFEIDCFKANDAEALFVLKKL